MTKCPNQALTLLLTDLGVLVERRWAAALSTYGITPAEYGLLALLVKQGPMIPVAIGSQVTLEQSLISRTAQRLYEKRLITRRRSQTDRRNVTLRATDAGAELVSQLDGPLRELAEELARGIPPHQFQQAAEVIEAIIGNLESPED